MDVLGQYMKDYPPMDKPHPFYPPSHGYSQATHANNYNSMGGTAHFQMPNYNSYYAANSYNYPGGMSSYYPNHPQHQQHRQQQQQQQQQQQAQTPSFYVPEGYQTPSSYASAWQQQQQQQQQQQSQQKQMREEQRGPSKFILGGDGQQQGMVPVGHHHQQQQQQLDGHMDNVFGRYENSGRVLGSIPSIPAVAELRNSGSSNGICRSSSSGILSSQNSQNFPPSNGFPTNASVSIASSLNTLAFKLGLSDRFSPSSASSASIDSGFAEITSFPSSPDSNSNSSTNSSTNSSQGKPTGFSSLPQSNSTHSLMLLCGSANAASVSAVLPTKNVQMPLQMPSLQNPSTQYGQSQNQTEVASDKCDPPPMKMRKMHWEESSESQQEKPTKATQQIKDLPQPAQQLQESVDEPMEFKYVPVAAPDIVAKAVAAAELDSLMEQPPAIPVASHQPNIKLETIEESTTTFAASTPQKESSVPLLEPEPRIEPAGAFTPSSPEKTSTTEPNYMDQSQVAAPEEDFRGQFACGWAKCEHRLATDNELYDHVLKEHLDKLRPKAIVLDEQSPQKNSGSSVVTVTGSSLRASRRRRSSNGSSAKSTKSAGKEKEGKFRCRWKDCEMFLQRGDSQKQFDWLLDHYTTRHAPRAQPFVCLFAQCSLRFRVRRSLNEHLRCAHDNERRNGGKRNGSSEENKAASSCFGFRPRVTIPPKLDCMDTRTMDWVRDQLKQFNQMQKPCLIVENQPPLFGRQLQLLNSRAQFRKMRRHSTQFLMEFDKILSFKRSISNLEGFAKIPEVNDMGIPFVADKTAQKMPLSETLQQLRGLFKHPRKSQSPQSPSSLSQSSVSSSSSTSETSSSSC